MKLAVLMCLAGALCFGLMACVSKLAERKKCNTSALVVWIFAWATLFMAGQSFRLAGKFQLTWPVVGLAVGLGICAAVGYFAFQSSIALGKVTVAWLMMNLSAGVPALVSIYLYGEKMSLLKSIAFTLALVALLCLFQGNRLETRVNASGGAA
jgi:drug/metabolite transporter (DMT)-like permease